ncbi:unnamed protein product [Didymodactylos carnosus]|uniref:Uncharacterized protein n=1 Tax=Didymodactylos carnosus TaxID=1234261 RepID=A0A814BV10_9BILA|nr:unnamed protein product [Didymodactylos carnosus]CAF3711459.1 unnamed protein product [Didymodactylos carnosus]
MGHHPSKFKPNKSYSLTPKGGPPFVQPHLHDLSRFAVITVIFNPVHFHTRYELYHRFAKHMADSNVRLFTVECIFHSTRKFGLPEQKFEVTNANNPDHFQFIAPSIIWLKENLINIAVTQLPKHIEYIAWIDADVEFERLDWPHLAMNAMQKYSIVQLFECGFFCGPNGKNEILRRDYSFAYSIRNNKPIDPKRKDWYAHPGYAWTMKRSDFILLGGLLDFSIVGSADLHFAFALLNRVTETFPPGLHLDYASLTTKWAEKLYAIANGGENVGYIPVNLYHYWHGSRENRHYVDRWSILERNRFSPYSDLEKHDNGLLRLTGKGNRRTEVLEQDIVNYFKSRNEDMKIIPSPQKPSQPVNRPKPNQQPQKKYPQIAPPRRTGNSSNFSRPVPSAIRWTSGGANTHVDDDQFYHHCTCHGHHHHPGNHDCPCYIPNGDDCFPHEHHGHHGHHSDQQEWNTDHHNHPQDWQHTHHHHDDPAHSGGHHHHDDHAYSGGHHHHDDHAYSGGHHWGHDASHHDYSSGHTYDNSGGNYSAGDYSGGNYTAGDYSGGNGSFY